MSETDYKAILLQLCASLTKVDHMGAAWEEVETALDHAGIDIGADGGASGITAALAALGVTTLEGEPLEQQADYPPYYDM